MCADLAGFAHAAARPPVMSSVIPWAMRALLLLPLLQVGGCLATVRQLCRWRRDPERRPKGRGKWGRHLLLSAVVNLIVALNLAAVLGKRRGYLRLFLPDYYWTALVCGSFAAVWGCLRSGLVLWTLRVPPGSERGSAGAVTHKETEV